MVTDRTLVDGLLRRAKQAPESIAMQVGQRETTISELIADAHTLAEQHLAGQPPASVVLIEGPVSPEFVTAQVACRLANLTYLPFDHLVPDDRLRSMIADAGPTLGLATGERSRLVEKQLVSAVREVVLGAGSRTLPGQQLATLSDQMWDARHPVCLMYTSGSTGRAKGVRVLDQGIARLAADDRIGGITRGRRVAQMATVSFDATHFETWVPLLAGGTLCFPAAPVTGSPRAIARYLVDSDIEVCWLTAGLFQVVSETVGESLHGLEHLVVGGDIVSPGHVAPLLARGSTVWNGYGPTEATTFTTFHRISPEDLDREFGLPIGTAVAGTKLDVLGDRHRGELIIGGQAVAGGYLNLPAETKTRFVEHDFGDGPEPAYRSGDEVAVDEHGVFSFVGRLDRQVKIGGVRLELEEVERLLVREDGVDAAFVEVVGDDASSKRLRARLYCPDPTSAPDERHVRDRLRVQLPAGLTLGEIQISDKIGFTHSGKLDGRGAAARS